jgi:DNA-binding PadR family transcriptional regulator
MLNQELIILGLLQEGPKHGYEIRKQLKNLISLFAYVETKSIYYPLRVMAKDGLLEMKSSRQGTRPEKYVYTITSKGLNKFKQLLSENLSLLERPILNLDISLYFLPYLKKEDIVKRLSFRLKLLKRIKNWLAKQKVTKNKYSRHLLAILEHNLELILAEIKFTSCLIRDIDKIQGR